MTERDRPDPEELLDRYQLRDTAVDAEDVTDSDEERDVQGPRQRGRLRVYLGMAAGVGKTYAMLNEGHRRKARGTDVVVGLVETHNRPITAQQIGDLELIPRRNILYRGVTLQEMDVDAILARHPQVALIDEMAHTNIPSSRNEKRYQDIEELRDAGITVISTLNIQHLESLNDIVESITGVRQRETLPDEVLDKADEVELIDIAPDALRSRMRHGNVYPADRAQVALQQYFTLSNLTALRELALRRTAEKTEDQLEVLMRGYDKGEEPLWKTTATERVMVAFDGRPNASHLLRAGWRLARGLKAPLLAVTVRQSGLASSESLNLRHSVELAVDLGAEVIEVPGRDVALALAQVAREQHVTQIVIGPPARAPWQEMLRGSVVNRLLRLGLAADIHVVSNKDVSPTWEA